MATFGERVRDARVAKRMTIRALADAMGVSAPFICDVEHGRRTLSADRVKDIAGILEVDPITLEVSRGFTKELADWIKSDPDLIELLHRAYRDGLTLCVDPRSKDSGAEDLL